MENETNFTEILEDCRKTWLPTEEEKRSEYLKNVKELREKFFNFVINTVEDCVVEKRKSFTFEVTDRRDVVKLRHIIRRISKSMGFQIRSMKKRHVIVEDTKFIVNVAKKSVNNTKNKLNTGVED